MSKKRWKNKRDRFKRPIGRFGKPKERILIVCEGEKTEPNYFRSFRISSAKIVIKGLGYDPQALVGAAIEERDKAKKNDETFQQVWCVFDRDSFPPNRFNNAISNAANVGIRIAYSNEAFELWYILHFQFIDAALSRNQYSDILSKNLGFKYKKNSKVMYDFLLDKQDAAINNSINLLNRYYQKNPEQDNPSTTIHELVENLNKYK